MMKVLAVQIVVACFPVSHWSRGRHGVQRRFGWLTACAPALGTCSRITRMPCCNSTRSWEMAGHRDVVSGIAHDAAPRLTALGEEASWWQLF